MRRLTKLDSGADNYFSSDIPDEVAKPYWSRIEKPLLIVMSAKDEFVNPELDLTALTNRWKGYCRAGIASDLSSPVPGANHRAEQPEAEKVLVDRVSKFLQGI